MTSVPMPPAIAAGTAPSQRSQQPGAELAELVGAADEEHVDRADAAAHRLRRGELHHGGAHEDAHAHRPRP